MSCYEPDVEEVLRPGAVIQDDKYYLGTSLSYASYLERNATDGRILKMRTESVNHLLNR